MNNKEINVVRINFKKSKKLIGKPHIYTLDKDTDQLIDQLPLHIPDKFVPQHVLFFTGTLR